MKTLFLFLSIFVCQSIFAQSIIQRTADNILLKNKKISFNFNLKEGTYSVCDNQKGWVVLDNVYISSNCWNDPFNRSKLSDISYTVSENKSFKNGKSIYLTLVVNERQLPEYKWEVMLGDDNNYLEFRIGMSNTLSHDSRLMTSRPVSYAQLFPGKVISDVQTLNGAAGKDMACVLGNVSRESTNSMLLTCLVDGNRYSLVWGGLKYKEFYAKTYYDHARHMISLEMTDPVGKLVPEGETFWTADTYYLGLVECNPFYALEDYGLKLREASHASPNLYDYPTLCGWAVGRLSGDKNINNSVSLIEQLEAANKCGLTKYTDVAIRLEADSYCYINGNTEHGWWDDEHWSRFGHLRKPYDTFAKWCKAMRANNGVPFTYFQASMPSDDFAEAHPDWMLNEDISRLDVFHQHQLPNIRYDYTDKGFQKHVLKVWNNLKKAGIEGIKFDYPETAWNPEGGFDDKFATTTSAYSTLYKLARKGLGPDARLLERNLGASGRPTLDVTAGIVDLQRIAQDNNKFRPEYISSEGLRWYKSRSVFYYYPDCKDLLPLTTRVRQSLVTMIALTSGMLELATSFERFTPEMVHDVSRIYPMYDGIKSPRPLDAFTGVKDPMIYDLELTNGWHQLAVFNTGNTNKKIQVNLGEELVDGGLNLDHNKKYYVYDFWNNKFMGLLSGNDVIYSNLETLETNLYSIKEQSPAPQIIHTNRHIFQGWMDIKDIKWSNSHKTLSGTSSVTAGETYNMVIALNEQKGIDEISAKHADIVVKDFNDNPGLKIISINSSQSGDIKWNIKFN